MKRKGLQVFYALTIVLLTLSVLSSSVSSSLISNENVDFNAEDDYLTISDLSWTFGYMPIDPNALLSLNPPSGFTYDINDTELHVLETGTTSNLWVGCYAEIPIINDAVEITFEGRAKADSVSAIYMECYIFDGSTDRHLYTWSYYLPKVGTTDTGFNYQNRTFIVNDLDSVFVFFAYRDISSSDYSQEFWIRNLKIYNELSKDIFLNENVLEVFRAGSSYPRGLVWQNDSLYSLVGGGRVRHHFFEHNPKNGAIISTGDASTSDPLGLATDGTYFYQTYHGGYSVYVYDYSFNYVRTISMSAQAYGGGLAYGGGFLWVVNYDVDNIYKVNIDSGNVVDTIPPPGDAIRGLEYYDGYLWVNEFQERKIYQIYAENGTIVSSYNSPYLGPWGITISSDGKIWLTCEPFYFIYKTNIQAFGDSSSPIIDNVDEIIIEEGTTGNYINWTLHDINPNNFSIFKDGELVEQDTWIDGEIINLNIDFLSIGIYNYTIIVYDAYSNYAVKTIMVKVTTTAKTSYYSKILFILPVIFFIILGRRKKNKD